MLGSRMRKEHHVRSRHSVMTRDRIGSGRSARSALGRGLAICLTVAAVVIMPATALATTPGDWPQFREAQTHQANNTNETALTDANVHALTKVWSGATGGAVNSSPATASGVVYVGSSDGKLYAFAAGCATLGGTCTPIWTGATGGAITSSPAVAAGDVFIGSADGKLYAFKIGCGTGGASCNPVWTATTGGSINSSPSVNLSTLYIGSADGKLYAFDATGTIGCSGIPKSCTPIWTGATGGAVESSPAATNGVVYVGSDDGKLYAFSATCGTGGAACLPLWTATTGGAIHSSPSIASNKLYVGSLDGKFYAFDALGVTGCTGTPVVCTPIWTATTGGAITTSAAEGESRVWIASDDGKLYTFHPGCATGGGTCTPMWTANVGHPIDSSPAYANDVVYIGASDGNAYAFDGDCPTATCSPLWSSSIGTAVQSSPTVTNGVVYVGSNDGKLYAFGLPVDHLVVTPATMSIPSGANQTYAAEGFTAANADLGNLTSAATFTISGSGTCLLNVCGSATSGTYTVTATYGAAHGTATLTVTSHGSTFHALTPPVRLLDTRTGNGLVGKLAARNPRTFHITGRGGIPVGATAVTGNVTAVNETNGWAAYLGPVPLSAPTTSTVNFTSGQVTGNGLTVALAADGTLSATYISTSGNTADLVFDVTGYFTPDSTGATYHPMNPARLLDTRSGNGLTGKLFADTPRTFQVAGRNGVPANAKAVTGNVTVVNETNAWALYLGPAVEPNPTTSTVNFVAGQVQGNNLTVALSASGQLSTTYISTSGNSTDLVFDVTGYYTADTTGSTYVPISPARLLDTRSGVGLTGNLSADAPRTFTVAGRGGVAANATGVTGNLTVVNETNAWAVFLGPVAQANPTTSTINFVLGDVKGNGLAVALSGTGTLSATYISTSGNTTDLVFDVTGYFVP
jgi:outer membrane protein assembly factor BamB